MATETENEKAREAEMEERRAQAAYEDQEALQDAQAMEEAVKVHAHEMLTSAVPEKVDVLSKALREAFWASAQEHGTSLADALVGVASFVASTMYEAADSVAQDEKTIDVQARFFSLVHAALLQGAMIALQAKIDSERPKVQS